MNKQSLFSWLQNDIDGSITHNDIADDLFYKTVESLESLKLEINDIKLFRRQFILFLYNHSSKLKDKIRY